MTRTKKLTPFARLLRAELDARGWSRVDLMQRLDGVSRAALDSYFHGLREPTLASALAIGDALDWPEFQSMKRRLAGAAGK